MEQPRRSRRVSFSDKGHGKLDESSRSRGRSRSESFRSAYDDEEKMKMRDDYNGKKSEFAASIAAAAYAIYSLEETRAEYERLMVDSFRESFRDPNTKRRSTSFRESFRKSITLDQDNTSVFNFDLPNSGRPARRSSSQMEKHNDEATRISSTRPIAGLDQRRELGRVETKADGWERARLEKINKWYEKMNKKILEWENEKKKRATEDMERRKEELDRLKRINMHHYANKIERIEDVSRGARKQLEEKKRSEEAYAREKAKKIRSTGKVAVQCLCFEC